MGTRKVEETPRWGRHTCYADYRLGDAAGPDGWAREHPWELIKRKKKKKKTKEERVVDEGYRRTEDKREGEGRGMRGDRREGEGWKGGGGEGEREERRGDE
jgi:hypothetical protein